MTTIIEANGLPGNPAERGYATRIGRTTKRRHVTGMMAMNIPDPAAPGGDWHQDASWFGAEPEDLPERFYTNGETYEALATVLGDAGVRDARAGLRMLNHPDGLSGSPVWAAAYDRAIIEIAWKQIVRERSTGRITDYIPVDHDEARRWLFRPVYWIRVNWWAWRVGHALSGDERTKWDAWRREWRPW